MLKEIFEQPAAVQRSMAPYVDLKTRTLKLQNLGFGEKFEDFFSTKDKTSSKTTEQTLASIDRIFIVACGTSYYAGLVGEYLIENLARVPVEVEYASEFRYRNPVFPPNSLLITVSQSGETADTLAALRLAKQNGVKTLSICNVPGSTIDREADGHIYMSSGVEVGVASTKAFTSTLALFNVFSYLLAKIKEQKVSLNESEFVDQLTALPAQMELVLVHSKFFEEAAQTLKNFKGFLYIARGANFPIALEGALKLKELAYMHAEGYAAGEMKHGPIALIDKNMAVVVIAPDDDVYEKTVSNLEEVRARGGQIISIGTEGNERLKKLSLHLLSLPKASWTINPILAVLPVQLLSYHVANALGHDVDQPRNLAKSVTVE
jgi:glucosamine--fructose-6-phosphate aminotransferase (isomerizing)